MPAAVFSQPSMFAMQPAMLPSSWTESPCPVLWMMATRFFSCGMERRTASRSLSIFWTSSSPFFCSPVSAARMPISRFTSS